jgi:acetyltransferase
MSVRNLARLFGPRRVAVVGASTAPGSIGAIVLDNLVSGGFGGIVHPINPRHDAVHGIEAHPSVGSLPEPADLAIICTPAATVPDVVRECGEAGVTGAVIVSAGFRETGADGAELERRVDEVASGFDGFRIVGPNCLGFLVPSLGLNASFARARPLDGRIALVSQSGALVTAILDWAAEQRIGFSTVVSAGNMLDVDFGDVIDHLAQDGHTQSLILYVESITNPRKFMSAARAFAQSKPIVAYKAGRFAESAQAAVSHTGAMAGADDVYEAALRRAGIVRVDGIEEVFDAAALLAGQRRPRGARLGIVTNAGGPGVMASDALLGRNGSLATFEESTRSRLADALPGQASVANPVDVLGDASADRYAQALAAVMADGGVDAVLAVLTPQAMTDAVGVAESVLAAAGQSRKLTLAAWMGGTAVAGGRERLEVGGVPVYETPEQAVGAFMRLVSYARNRETLYETPRTIPVDFALDRGRVRDLLSGVLMEGTHTLPEAASKALLDAYGIPVTRPFVATSASEAVSAAERIGYPVVLKVLATGITHKTDVGGVVVDVGTDSAVQEAFERITSTVAERAPDAQVQGVTVQAMVTGPGHELIVGARKDPTFGAVILVGAGGVVAELLGDTVLELPPLNERLARRMLERLRAWPLLTGYRGAPPVDLDALLEVLMRFSYLVADYPDIDEVEINPLHAGPDGAVALDARVALDPERFGRPVAPYSHLAIRPYPEELTTHAELDDGTPLTLRPIRPEDEPLWHEMLAASSEESIRSRFRGLFKHASHEAATRYCFIDYDREMAIVAEARDGDRTRLLGVGRIVTSPDRTDAEYAVLIADPWQGQGLAGLLTDRCVEIAKGWGVARVWAETDHDNRRMLAVMRRRGFALEPVPEEGAMRGTLELGPR